MATLTIAARLDAKKAAKAKYQHDKVQNANSIHLLTIPLRLDGKKAINESIVN